MKKITRHFFLSSNKSKRKLSEDELILKQYIYTFENI
jgi:hypothetical protein